MSQPSHGASADDEFEQTFPGCVLTHVLTVVSQDQLLIAMTALSAVHALGGQLEALSLSRRSGRLEHQLKIVGLRSQQARLLADQLAALPGVDRANIEHHLARA